MAEADHRPQAKVKEGRDSNGTGQPNDILNSWLHALDCIYMKPLTGRAISSLHLPAAGHILLCS